MKKTSQRSLLFRQNVNRTEAEWVHFLDVMSGMLGLSRGEPCETVVKRSFEHSGV